MALNTNILEFRKGFNCGSQLLEAYCRLIAIELKLERLPPLKSHAVLDKLQNLSQSLAGTPNAASLNAHITALQNAFGKIFVEAKQGTVTLPQKSYPTLRYTRYSTDWPSNATNAAHIRDLNTIVMQTIATLRKIGHAI